MFERLQQKWNVSGWQLLLILCTFALGGSMCGYITRLLIQPMKIGNPLLYGSVYFISLTLLWPICVILVSIPLGQFVFFKHYLQKMAMRFGLFSNEIVLQNEKIKLAIFASGSGSNALVMMQYFNDHPTLEIGLLVSNKPGSGALHHAANMGVSTLLLEKIKFHNGDGYLPELKAAGIDFIILAGFLWKIPTTLTNAYAHKIVNIHPALLPKFGGKGMYGIHVHSAVIAAGEKESGITIHFVDEQYDHGATLFQAMCPVLENDTAETLAARVLSLEHLHYVKVVESLATERL